MKISVLDCTLRDGGYINDFNFGADNIAAIEAGLCNANIEIIERGFLRSCKQDPERSLYGAVEQIILPPHHNMHMFVAMIVFGEISADEIAPRLPDYIDGIRLTFHNSEWEEAEHLAKELMDKGYKIFIQPVGTLSYTDEELLNLIKLVNELHPFAFYIVDTLGSMLKNDLLRLFFLVEHNLAEGIAIGFHSHNNMQLSFSNAIGLLELHTDRHIILDSSVFGMGRGAGNLNTELITHYINNNIENRYNTMPLLDMMDEIILPIYKNTTWGFSEPYYMAAIRGVHPNYASYLINKKSMSMSKIADLLDRLPQLNRHLFRETLIEEIYFADSRKDLDDFDTIVKLRAMIASTPLLVIVPGASIFTQSALISDYISSHHPFVISVNFVPDQFVPNLIFAGNQRRYEHLRKEGDRVPLVVSSNISGQSEYVVDYNSLLSGRVDWSGLMVLMLLIRLGVKEVSLAGYDGFSSGESYHGKEYDNYLSNEAIDNLNNGMNAQLAEISKQMGLSFITKTTYTL